jgi:lipid II:glycine glycyltransferase (peptidoglycan interpeptide bridge formation enzyme)
MKEVTDAALWNTFASRHAPRSGAFLQSFEWGSFQSAIGRTVRRVMARPEEGARVEMAVQLIEMPLPLGQRYWYCPRGPIVAGHNFDANMLVAELKGLGSDAMFLRFDPPVEKSNAVAWKNVKPTIAIQPADTLLTDLSTSTEKLLDLMHHKTRYNIRLAQKKGVEIEIRSGESMDRIWPLFRDTSFRRAFNLHDRAYYEAMVKHVQGRECQAFFAVAKYHGEVIAANIMVDFAGTRTYLHGASGDRHRNVMAPYLLHWALIEDAQKQGMRWYDWWGIAPAGVPSHPWAGVTRFKFGFGGEQVHYPGTFDVIAHPSAYAIYQAGRALVRRFRG